MTKRAAGVMVLLLALTGCVSSQPVSNPPSTLSDATRNEVSGVDIPPGRIDEAVTKVDSLVGELMKASGIPGVAVAIVHSGTTLYAKGFGNGDTFSFALSDEKAPAGTRSKASFTGNTLNLDYFDSHKLGTFTR
jgi:CubicO group peptidase (beta-lactamase class C family)